MKVAPSVSTLALRLLRNLRTSPGRLRDLRTSPDLLRDLRTNLRTPFGDFCGAALTS
jgi:hypothetical protein